ncbi:MAG TPA: protein kinase [Thermoanaerobaculia bacterium]|jgi:serine/threonine protein kinase|nr:protein kinase [Thermoanaerobaculia bacterium]
MDFAPYRLITRLGMGGMGEVWRAEDTRLQRPVAIKILSRGIAEDPEWKERFFREARTIAQLSHPNIATIYAIEEAPHGLFIVMELVEGESLAAKLKRGPLTLVETLRLAREAADALGEAHEKQIVHRDIKPDNIILSRRGAKILDFGIAKRIGSSTPQQAMTQAGMVVGTIQYMSPEQALGKDVDARTDIFALGSVLYECLSGKRAFEGDTPTGTLMQVITAEPEDLRSIAPNVPAALIDIVKKAMKKRVEDRFQTMDELALAVATVDPTAPAAPRVHRRSSGSLTAITSPLIPPPKPAEAPQAKYSEPPPGGFGRSSKPAAPRIPTPPRALPAVKPMAQAENGSRRALIADDDPVARHLIGAVLKRNGVPYDEAENGADAVKRIKAQRYSLIFLDLLMPRIDGWGVLDYLRRARAEDSPALYVITGVKDQSISNADRDFVTGVIYKPLDPLEVERAVKKR